MAASARKSIRCYASAARVASPAAMENKSSGGARGIEVIIDITAVTATPALTVTIQGYDPESGKYYTLLASTALALVATTVLRVYPGLTAAANLVASLVLPPIWRVVVAHGDSDSATYSVGANLLP